MKKYFDAGSAREICDEVNNRPPWIVELECILETIELSARSGRDNIYENIQYETTKNKLIELGYNVNISCVSRADPNLFIPMDYMKISW